MIDVNYDDFPLDEITGTKKCMPDLRPSNSDCIKVAIRQVEEKGYTAIAVWVEDSIYEEVKHLDEIIKIKKQSEKPDFDFKAGSFLIETQSKNQK